jgi:pimeloyl-ACP methyl ester carboxylesterase
MRKLILTIASTLLLCAAHGQTLKSELIEIDLGRTEGLFSQSPVLMRAIALSSPTKPPPDTALLFFRGWPGVAHIKDADDWKLRGNLNFFLKSVDYVVDQDITLVLMDCPSDQWGLNGRNPIRCDDAYRESEQYANDVRGVMAQLRQKMGVKKFFIIGHSYGSISSRWLAINLGHEIAGSIHSASMTGPAGGSSQQYGISFSRIDLSKAKAPYTYMHNVDDQCLGTVYKTIKSIAGERLIAIQGGGTTGGACGGKHYHSYEDRELDAAKAVVTWIRSQP